MIRVLELKVPPGLLVAIFAAGIWLTRNTLTLSASLNGLLTSIALVLIALAMLILVASSWAFFRANTTVDPRQPMAANTLLTTGLFAFSRNPIYLAFAFILIAWGSWLTSFVAIIWVAGFIIYVQIFQIIPEERLLTRRFGQSYLDYCRQVRRWF